MTDRGEVERLKCEKDEVQNENVNGRREFDFARLVTRTKEIMDASRAERG